MNDTISRQAAIDAANDWLLDCLHVQKQDRSCGLIRRLEDLSPAQPEHKKGKWITLSNSGFAECACGYITDKYCVCNFCPNCGADMRGVVDEET